MDTIVAMPDRRDAACADRPAEVRATMHRARRLFAEVAGALEGELDRLKLAPDEARAKEVGEAVRAAHKALQTVLEIEVKLMREEDREIPGRTVIDLEEARAEISRRLDRLAA